MHADGLDSTNEVNGQSSDELYLRMDLTEFEICPRLWKFKCDEQASMTAHSMGFVIAATEAVAVVKFEAFATKSKESNAPMQTTRSMLNALRPTRYMC